LCAIIAPMASLLIATDNPGKRHEYEQLLAPLQVELCSPRDVDLIIDVREGGCSYAENARIKALAYVERAAMLTLADDSGLEVDALHGEPGLHSARYAGPHATDADRYRLLLSRLDGVPPEGRTARFRCCLALAVPGSDVHESEGICEGVITTAPRGEHGFGYDPIFYLPHYGQTMAQLPPEVKNRISHRACAVQAMWPILARLLGARDE